jgi:hypothetical protein
MQSLSLTFLTDREVEVEVGDSTEARRGYGATQVATHLCIYKEYLMTPNQEIII